MDEQSNGIRIEGIVWREVFPFLRLFGSFRMAIQPTKLLIALLMVVLVGLAGRVIDRGFGSHVYYQGEREHLARILQYERDPTSEPKPEGLVAWRHKRREETRRRVEELMWQAGVEDDVEGLLESASDIFDVASEVVHESFARRHAEALDSAEELDSDSDGKPTVAGPSVAELKQQRRAVLAKLAALRPRGIVAEVVVYKQQRLGELATAAVTLNLGWGDMATGLGGLRPGAVVKSSDPSESPSVLAVLHQLFVALPRWLGRAHFWPAMIMVGVGGMLWALLGGALARAAALHAARGQSGTFRECIRFGVAKFFWFLMAPVIPLLLALLIAGLLMLGGLLANLWVADILAGMFYFVAFLGGLVIVLVVLGLLAGHNLLFPAIAVEGTDAFDAISRVYNYALGRPWRTLFYNGIALMYGSLTYLFITVVVYLAMSAARWAVGLGHMTHAYGVPVFEAMVPAATPGGLTGGVDWTVLGWSASVAAALVSCWTWIAVSGLLAFAVSFYVSASTWVYLLLRRSADATEHDDVWMTEESDRNGGPPPPATVGDEATPPVMAD